MPIGLRKQRAEYHRGQHGRIFAVIMFCEPYQDAIVGTDSVAPGRIARWAARGGAAPAVPDRAEDVYLPPLKLKYRYLSGIYCHTGLPASTSGRCDASNSVIDAAAGERASGRPLPVGGR